MLKSTEDRPRNAVTRVYLCECDRCHGSFESTWQGDTKQCIKCKDEVRQLEIENSVGKFRGAVILAIDGHGVGEIKSITVKTCDGEYFFLSLGFGDDERYIEWEVTSPPIAQARQRVRRNK